MAVTALWRTMGASQSGAIYLFDTNGIALPVLSSPMPATSGQFGRSVARLGNDRIIIGAPFESSAGYQTGSAYIFSTNGTQLASLVDPGTNQYDNFGVSVAALGTDLVIVGAQGVSIGAAGAGAAFLFDTNGTLLTTITNPFPVAGDQFGYSVATAGSDRILVGALGKDAAAANAGAAYLFDTNGILLTCFTNPTPRPSDQFGSAVAAVGVDRVLIGADRDSTGSYDAGAAYLFSILPRLTGRVTPTNTIALSWHSPSPGFILQQNTNSLGGTMWNDVGAPVQEDGTNRMVVTSPLGARGFYRLYRP